MVFIDPCDLELLASRLAWYPAAYLWLDSHCTLYLNGSRKTMIGRWKLEMNRISMTILDSYVGDANAPVYDPAQSLVDGSSRTLEA